MNKKLEKLKEINEMIANVLTKIETYIFIENIDINNKNNEEKPDVIIEIKR